MSFRVFYIKSLEAHHWFLSFWSLPFWLFVADHCFVDLFIPVDYYFADPNCLHLSLLIELFCLSFCCLLSCELSLILVIIIYFFVVDHFSIILLRLSLLFLWLFLPRFSSEIIFVFSWIFTYLYFSRLSSCYFGLSWFCCRLFNLRL